MKISPDETYCAACLGADRLRAVTTDDGCPHHKHSSRIQGDVLLAAARVAAIQEPEPMTRERLVGKWVAEICSASLNEDLDAYDRWRDGWIGENAPR